jgi:hypothetical protein
MGSGDKLSVVGPAALPAWQPITSRLLKKRDLCGFLVAEGLTMSDYDERSMRS